MTREKRAAKCIVMTREIVDRAANAMFSIEGRTTRNIKYFYLHGQNYADQLADYRSRVHAQIKSGVSVENTQLDAYLLD